MLDKVYSEVNKALKSGDKARAEALRMLYSSLKTAKIDNGGSLNEEDALRVVKKEIKKRVEARDMFAQNDRQELADKEEYERALFAEFAPKELNTEQIDKLITEAASETSDVNFGALMSAVMKKAAGQADGKTVSARVKDYISKQGK